MVVQPAYKMSFSTGGLFVNESISVARLHKAGESWKETILTAMADGSTSLPKAASNRRTLREIANRVSCLTEEERHFLINQSDRPEQEALLWLAACRAYRFVREFAIEVIRERFMSYRVDLPLDAFDHFFDGKAEWHPELTKISPSTRLKLRQILFRMLREAGVIDGASNIRPAYLSSRVIALIDHNAADDLLVFPGLRP
jgi:hypothetical protein